MYNYLLKPLNQTNQKAYKEKIINMSGYNITAEKLFKNEYKMHKA